MPVTGSIGNQEVNLVNAATEATLAALLAAAQKTGAANLAALQSLAQKSGISKTSLDDAAAKLKKLGDAADGAATSTAKVSKIPTIVGAVVQDLVGGIVKTGANLVDLGGKALEGTARMSDFFGAMKDLPIVGVVAGLFQALAKFQEANLDSYRKLTDAGINFSGDLLQIRSNALAMGLTLDEFTQVMTSNSENFRLMGAGANDGAKNFVAISTSLRASKLGQQLLEMGYTFAELSTRTAAYTTLIGGLSQQQQKDTKGVAAAVANYATELDLMSRITGQSREQAEKDLKVQLDEANWKAYLSTLDDETRAQLVLGATNAQAALGKGGVEIFKAQALGVAVQGKAGQMTTALFGAAAETIRNSADLAKAGKLDQAALTNTTAKAMVQSASEYKKFSTSMNAMALQGSSDLTVAAGAGATNAVALKNAGITTEEGARKFIETQRINQQKIDGQAKAMIAGEEAMKKFGSDILEALLPVMKELTAIMPKIVKGFTALAPVIAKFVENLFTEAGRTKIINDLSKLLADLISGVWEHIFSTKKANEDVRAQANAGLLPASGDQFIDMGALSELNKPVAGPAAAPKRAFGSLGTTGKLFENFGSKTNVELHGTESVVTPSQLDAIMQGSAMAGTNALAESLSELTSISSQMLHHIRETADYTKRNLAATKALSNDLFAA